MSFDFMNFANQQAALGNAYEGLQQQTQSKLTRANDAITQAVKLTQLNFDEKANSAKTLIEGGMEGIGSIEGVHQLYRAGKKIYNKLKSKADEFNQNELDKLDQEAADRTEDSFKVKVEGDENNQEGIEDINDDANVDEVADTGLNNADDNISDFAPYRDAPSGEIESNVEELGDFGENVAEVGDDLASNIGEMGGEMFSNAVNSFKQMGQSGIDAMNEMFDGLKGKFSQGGTSQPEIEMTDMNMEGRMPVDADYQPQTEYSRGNFGEKVDKPVNEDEGIELTDFQKNEGSLEKEGQNLEQTEGDAERTMDTSETAETDINEGDLDAAEEVDPEIEETIGEIGEDTAEIGIEEGVGAALDATPLAPLGWILGAIGGAAAVGTTIGGIVKEVQAGHQEENSLAQAKQQYNLAKAKVANFNPSGNYAIPSMNSLAQLGQ